MELCSKSTGLSILRLLPRLLPRLRPPPFAFALRLRLPPSPNLMQKSGFDQYYDEAVEPGKRERAYAWATAIGLQDVDHLRVSSFLVETAIRHINGEITQEQAREIIEAHYASAKRPHTRSYYGGYEYFDPETGEKIESLDVYEAQRRLKRGIRQHEKKAGRLRRIGPDKGGHWEAK